MPTLRITPLFLLLLSSLSYVTPRGYSFLGSRRGLTLPMALTEQESIVSSSTASKEALGRLFGVSRGGGLFGGGKSDEKKAEEAAVAAGDEEKVMYPAMSRQEVEDFLEHIPVFAVTDANGAGVVLKPENDTSVFYFFLNPAAANATLYQLKGANDALVDLKVSAFSLGKIWFNLLEGADGKEVLLKSPEGGEQDESVNGVEYRIVPDTRDLLGARMLLTMSPEDGEKLKGGDSMTPEMAQAAIQRAMTESPKFNTTFNEIPVFTIAQMRMQKQPAEGESGEAVTLLPMYFSLQNMVGTWQQFMSQAPTDVKDVEPAINLMSLHDLVGMMQKESEIDWRHVVLVPLTGGGIQVGDPSSAGAAGGDPMAQMGGATLGE